MNKYLKQIFEIQGYTVTENEETGDIDKIIHKDNGEFEKTNGDYIKLYTDTISGTVITIRDNSIMRVSPPASKNYYDFFLLNSPLSVALLSEGNAEPVVYVYTSIPSNPDIYFSLSITSCNKRITLSLTSIGAIINGSTRIPIKECTSDNFMKQINKNVSKWTENAELTKKIMQLVEPGLHLFMEDRVKEWENNLPKIIAKLSSDKSEQEAKAQGIAKKLEEVRTGIKNIEDQLDELRGRKELIKTSDGVNKEKGTNK